ncbi:MAG: UDP-N-acetylmuramate dehydrogenase [Bacteroidales bacterium]|nr:UDP-N-acetylmuramate dehydrogenase [Bacteroidales bacterium]
MEIFCKHSLKSYNTFGIDVSADVFIIINMDDELRGYLRSQEPGHGHFLILGGGSNILLTRDLSATVLKINTKGREIISEDEENIDLKVAAGEDWDELVAFSVANGWGGLENLSGIPGQVGSSPMQNIGAYGTELKDHFLSLEAMDRTSGEIIHFDTERCQFGYRDSIFKRAMKDRMIITHVTFRLKKQPVFNLSYTALQQKLSHLSGDNLNLSLIREAVLEIRRSKLPDTKVVGNAGSFFKNPVVSREALDELKGHFPGIVYFESSHPHEKAGGKAKLAAGWLIEQCGWKGYREGDAGVHKDQALVLVNYGNATGREILALSEKIRDSVLEKFGVTLEREVNVI